MKRAVIVGGFAEGKRLLEPVGHAVCAAGLAEDADIFAFRDAIENDEKLHRAASRQLTITHAAGIMAIYPAVQMEMLIAYNGPEPRGMGRLIIAALAKSANHLSDAVVGPHRYAHLRTFLGNNAELITHPLANLRQMRAISRFSTVNRLGLISKIEGRHAVVKAIATDKDEFFGAGNPELFIQRDVSYQLIPGGHDELLVNPAAVINKTFPSL